MNEAKDIAASEANDKPRQGMVRLVSRGVRVTPADLDAYARQLIERQHTAISLVAIANRADRSLDNHSSADSSLSADSSCAKRKQTTRRKKRAPKPDGKPLPPLSPPSPPPLLCVRCSRAKHTGDCFAYHRGYKQWMSSESRGMAESHGAESKHWPRMHRLKYVLESYGIEKQAGDVTTTATSSMTTIAKSKRHKSKRATYKSQTHNDALPTIGTLSSDTRLAWANRTLGRTPYSSRNLRAITKQWPRLFNRQALNSSNKLVIKL